MNDQKWLNIIKKVVHQGYERPKVLSIIKKVVHQSYERPKIAEKKYSFLDNMTDASCICFFIYKNSKFQRLQKFP
jgi:hypothetical protein